MSRDLEDLPLKWLHRVRNRPYLRENQIDMKLYPNGISEKSGDMEAMRWIESFCGWLNKSGVRTMTLTLVYVSITGHIGNTDIVFFVKHLFYFPETLKARVTENRQKTVIRHQYGTQAHFSPYRE